MRAKIRFVAAVMAVVVGVAWAQQGAPADAAAPPAEPDVVVLDTFGIWRMHCTLEPPVLASGETVKFKGARLNYKTPGPAKDWMKPQFNDLFWNRGPATLAVKTGLLSKVCLRGKFTVTNPADVKNMKLSVGYRGGIIVYLNGKELHREHVAKGKSIAEGVAGEERNIDALLIPNKLLSKGMNVIGLEIVRAPYAQKSDNGEVYEANGCEILHVRLTSTGASGVVPNALRPEGFHVWNTNSMTVDSSVDFGDPAEPLRAVIIMGARNGMFSGKVVVGSRGPIRGLKVTPGAFKGQGGTIPASNVHIRYGLPWGRPGMTTESRRYPSPYLTYADRLGALAEKSLDEFGVRKLRARGWPQSVRRPTPGSIKPLSGAVVPVWITVKVPANVKAGTYMGTVKIEAQGEKTVAVPVEVRVADWTVPNTQNYRTFVDIIQCPDTLALEYKVPLWSDEHFKLIARSFKLIGETGSRIVYIPLLAHTNLGNEESMVRWIKKGDKFEYDFSTMERYLDVAEKNMGGKPKLLVFNVWDVYMLPKSVLQKPHGISHRIRVHIAHIDKIGAKYGQGPMVTVFDPATQKTELMMLPSHVDAAASKPLWKPLMDELRERMKKRGLEKKMMFGLIHDTWPTKEQMAFFQDIAPDVPWAIHSHEGWHNIRRGKLNLMHGIARIAYQSRCYRNKVCMGDKMSADNGEDRRITSLYGWKRKDIVGQIYRFSREHQPNVYWRNLPEIMITGSTRGPGRLGGDYWMVIKNKKGRLVGRVPARYPESSWRNLAIPEALMARGPDGPVATDRMEAFRQGVQDCEARIVIEGALSEEASRAKLGPDLAKRCQEYLYARHMMIWLSQSNHHLFGRKPNAKSIMAYKWAGHYGPKMNGNNWYLSSGYQARTAKLYDLAGEVARKLNGK